MSKEIKKRILIIDTKAGNLFSLQAAIDRLGFVSEVLTKPNNEKYSAIIIPGQGRFGTVMNNLRADGWEIYLNQAREDNQPILGICVGMQIFFEASEEDPSVTGLSWFKGKVQALDFPKKPMVGWSKLNSERWPESTVYFVNSYAIKQSDASIATTTYGETFCAAVKRHNVYGVQFHPEKSSQAGSNIMSQILSEAGVNA